MMEKDEFVSFQKKNGETTFFIRAVEFIGIMFFTFGVTKDIHALNVIEKHFICISADFN